MELCKIKIDDINPAKYNPRKDLQPDDPEFEKIMQSIQEFGYVEPVVINRRTGNLVGGHQRCKVLRQLGYTEIEYIEVDLDEKQEKILNVALNRIKGRWDTEKLVALLTEIQELGKIEMTGFEPWELEALKMQYDHIDDLLNEEYSEYGQNEKDTFTMTFTLPAEVKEAVEGYIKQTPNGKTELSTAIINKVKEVLS